jgi:GntR family transcriptional regulator
MPLPGGLDPRVLVTPPPGAAGPGGDGGPADHPGAGLYHALAGLGLAVARAAETITPVLLDPAAARDLGRAAGSLALLSHRVSFTADGEPVIDDHAVFPGDSVAITATRSPDEIAVAYTLTPPPG